MLDVVFAACSFVCDFSLVDVLAPSTEACSGHVRFRLFQATPAAMEDRLVLTFESRMG
jgi:hypothetical protein